MKRIPIFGAALMLVAFGAFGVSAAPKQVSAVTHASNHADTTSVSGGCTVPSDNGPVWAYDNLSLKLTVTPGSAADLYSVTITANGSFDAFASPNTGACLTQHGSVDGWLQWDVQSSTAPNPKSLPAQVDGSLSQSQIMNMLFDGNAHIVGGGHYSYTYNRIDGGKYVQNG